MKMKSVNSSVIVALGYSKALKIAVVEFSGGKVYAYFGVSKSEFKALKNAESIGAYFNEHFKGHYKFMRIEK